MSKRSKHTAIEKYHCILPVLKGKASVQYTAKKKGVYPSTIQKWIHKYNLWNGNTFLDRNYKVCL